MNGNYRNIETEAYVNLKYVQQPLIHRLLKINIKRENKAKFN